MKILSTLLLAAALLVPAALAQPNPFPRTPAPAHRAAPLVETANGLVEGRTLESGIHVFRGIPYAAAPVRERRWKPPEPAAGWEGVRRADRFAAQCMQERVFDDMVFRNSGVSEDCLYLNVWTPEPTRGGVRPVLVYFYGGGFVAGDGSEPRYDGESMARRGIVVVTMSYRLGIFGFFAHPELTAESPHGASGNYGLLDQAQALRWVHENIAAFGGDPGRVTIAGESAGSFSVSAQMASPLSKDLIAGAIGESGSLLGSRAPAPRGAMERNGVAFGERVGAASLEALRGLSAMELLAAASKPGVPRFSTTVDGYFFPEPPLEVYARGRQARVPLLLGWNSEEMNYRALLGREEPTPANYAAAVRDLYGERAEEVLEVYPASSPEEVVSAATDLAGDRFIGFSTWKWFELHRETGGAPVFRYFYAHPRPARRGEQPGADRAPRGAVHSAEIEYAMGNLATNPVYAWTDTDHAVSAVMQGYFANFVATGDPNGPGLPAWPAAGSGTGRPPTIMVIDADAHAEPARHERRYRVLDRTSAE